MATVIFSDEKQSTDMAYKKEWGIYPSSMSLSLDESANLLIILPEVSSSFKSWELYDGHMSEPILQGNLETTLSLVKHSLGPLSTIGKTSLLLIITDNEKKPIAIKTAIIEVVRGKLMEALFNALPLLLAALLGVVSFLLQRYWTYRQERARERKKYKLTLQSVIKDVIHKVKSGEDFLIPDSIIDPGTSRWGDYIIEDKFQAAIQDMRRLQVEWKNRNPNIEMECQAKKIVAGLDVVSQKL